MGKDGDLWDDSALIKAFESAVNKYKVMHGMGGSALVEKSSTNAEENLAAAQDVESTEHPENGDEHYAEPGPIVKIEETPNLLKIKEDSPTELAPSVKCVGSSNIQNGNLLPRNENAAANSGSPGDHMILPDVKSLHEAALCSNGPEEYSQLLSKYYELEGERQKIVEQLNQYNNWNYHHPISSISTYEENHASVAQPYDTVTCYCPYGCQSLIFPCNPLPACSGCSCMDQSYSANLKGSKYVNTMSSENPDFVKMAMTAAERALSTMKNEASFNADVSAGNGKEFGVEIDHSTKRNKSTTDLDVVLNAWYSAGFFTGKYLSEQSFEKGKHGQGL